MSPASFLRTRLRDPLRELDPGGMRIVRGLHLLLAGLLAAGLGLAITHFLAPILQSHYGATLARALPAYADLFHPATLLPGLPLVAGVSATHLILFSGLGTREEEKAEMGRLLLLLLAFWVLLAGLAPGDWGLGKVPVEILWILVIGATLLCRPLGARFQRQGLALAIMALFAVLLNPDRAMGPWLVGAVLLGSGCAYTLRFATYRPSARRIYRVQRRQLLTELAATIRRIGEPLRTGRTRIEIEHDLHSRWRALVDTGRLVAGDREDLAQTYAAADAAAYRLILAADTVADTLAASRHDEDILAAVDRDTLVDRLDRLAARAEKASRGEDPGADDLTAELERMREDLLRRTDLAPRPKLRLMRFCTGLLRLEDILAAVDRDTLVDRLDRLAARAEKASRGEDPGADVLTAELERMREDLLRRTDLAPRPKLRLMRFCTGLIRLDENLRPPSAIGPETSVGESSLHAAGPVSPAGPSRRERLRTVGLRLGLQGWLAATLTTGLGWVLSLNHAYWITLTVIVVLSSSAGATLGRTFQRILGTTVGVAVAIVLTPLTDPLPLLEITFLALAVIALPLWIDRRYSIAAGLIGFVVVSALHLIAGYGIPTMLARVYDTVIGAGIALAVAWWFLPVLALRSLGGEVDRFLTACRQALRPVGECMEGHSSPPPSGPRLIRDLSSIHAQHRALAHEERLRSRDKRGFARLPTLLEVLVSYFGLYERAARNPALADLPAEALGSLGKMQALLDQGIGAVLAPEADFPPRPEVNDEIQRHLPLDGSLSAPPVVAFLEATYYGRRILDTLAEIREVRHAARV